MSEVTNVKVVRFEDGQTEGYGEALYTYDWGQKIRFEGIELPDHYEVHFSDLPNGVGTPRLGNADGVDVPRAYLMHPGMLYLWIFLHFSDSDGTTVYRAALEVIQKADGSVTPSEEEKDIIQQAIELLDQANQDVEHAQELAESMPRATYLECSYMGHYTTFAVGADLIGLNVKPPEGYDPRDNDLLFIKMTKDMVIPERSEKKVNISIVFDKSWSETVDGRTLVHVEEERRNILNIGDDYPAGMVAFDKNGVYAFRYRILNTPYEDDKYVYEIINYAPGMKEAVAAAAESAADAEQALSDLRADIAAQPVVRYYETNMLQRASGGKVIDGKEYPEYTLPINGEYEASKAGDIMMIKPTLDIVSPGNATTEGRFFFNLTFNGDTSVKKIAIYNTTQLQLTPGTLLFKAGRWYPIVFRGTSTGNRWELLEFHPEEADNVQTNKERAESAATRAEDAMEKYPIIGDNGNWWVWDATQEDYADTGYVARGEKGNKGEIGSEYTVLVQNSRPTEPSNKLWIQGDTGTVVELATAEECDAKADKTDTVLKTTLSCGRAANHDVGFRSIAYGYRLAASGECSTALGNNTIASGHNSLAMGNGSEAAGMASFASGLYSKAKRDYAAAFGATIANGMCEFACGYQNAQGEDFQEWQPNTKYKKGECVKALPASFSTTFKYYRCKYDHTSESSFAYSPWDEILVSGELLFSVGNGYHLTHTNAFEVLYNGTAKAQTALQIGSTAIDENQLQQLLAPAVQHIFVDQTSVTGRVSANQRYVAYECSVEEMPTLRKGDFVYVKFCERDSDTSFEYQSGTDYSISFKCGNQGWGLGITNLEEYTAGTILFKPKRVYQFYYNGTNFDIINFNPE